MVLVGAGDATDVLGRWSPIPELLPQLVGGGRIREKEGRSPLDEIHHELTAEQTASTRYHAGGCVRAVGIQESRTD